MVQSSSHHGGEQAAQELAGLASRVAQGDAAAEERLFTILRDHLAVSVQCYFPTADLDFDDIMVESLQAVFAYIRREGGFTGDLVRFAITVARNRCRNLVNQRRRRPGTPVEPLAEWIADDKRSALEFLLEDEAVANLRAAVDALGDVCRRLLRAFYFDRVPMERIRVLLGLKTVQGAYYRRTACLRELGSSLVASAD
jgi:DNA-directed RNA polymerase specialized sigma24 family protein